MNGIAVKTTIDRLHLSLEKFTAPNIFLRIYNTDSDKSLVSYGVTPILLISFQGILPAETALERSIIAIASITKPGYDTIAYIILKNAVHIIRKYYTVTSN